MTVAALIQQYNQERPNTVDDSEKILWLKKCEQMLISEVVKSHEYNISDGNKLELKVSGSTLYIQEAGSLENHISAFNLDTELIAPSPYDELYLHFLDKTISYNNNDTKRYNAASSMYNNALLCFKQYFNRTYKPKKTGSSLFSHGCL